jgi:FixJ family two-component response regulator
MGRRRKAGYAGFVLTTRGEMREGPLVAIVDDDKSIRNATQDLLKSAGFATATFKDAESFLSSASRTRAACLVADMKMPRMTGLELYKVLVASGHGIPTVIITAHPEELTQARAREAGITCYLTKPFAPDELLECVREAVAKSRSGRPIPKC